jgi:hypothetical protein
MTEKEKARELVERHMTVIDEPIWIGLELERMPYSKLLEKAKASARITAKEVLIKLVNWKVPKHTVEFWEQVLVEIDQL